MSISTVDFAPEDYGPDHKLLEALVKDSEEEWMKIIRERRKDIIGLHACLLICVLKRWTATLTMMAGLQQSLFIRASSWKESILYQYIRNNVLFAAAVKALSRPCFASVALVAAVRGGYTEDVKALLKIGSLPNPRNYADGSVLLDAVASRNIEIVRVLINNGSKDYFVGKCNMTAVAKAAQLGELEMMQEIGWSANDNIVLEHGVCGGNMEVVKTVTAARTEKFNLERISRLTKDESLRALLSEANAALPEKASTSTVPLEKVPTSMASRWRWFFARPKQSKAASKKQMDASTTEESSK